MLRRDPYTLRRDPYTLFAICSTFWNFGTALMNRSTTFFGMFAMGRDSFLELCDNRGRKRRYHSMVRRIITMAKVELRMAAIGTQHPAARPTLRCRPDRVKGTPIFREILPFIPEMPVARFHENEKPCFLPMI